MTFAYKLAGGLCVLATAALPSIALTPSAQADVPVPGTGLSLSSPGDGIVDPLMDVEPIEMTCADGQVDINHAAAGELIAAFDLGRPVARRLVDHRPYLQVSDLTIVPGIGPEELVAIQGTGLGCATPMTAPPPVFDTCEDDELDFNSATWEEIRDTVGVADPIAQRAAEQAPYLQLSNLIRVEGMDGPKLDRAQRLGCLTPWPISTDSTDYWWVSRASGGLLEKGDWLMAVRPGIVNDGAWMSITPWDDPVAVGAEFEIHGDFSGRIILGMPQDEVVLPGWDDPIVMHNPDDPDLIWAGSALFRTATGLRLSTEALSPYQTINAPIGNQSPTFDLGAPHDPNDTLLYQTLIEPIVGPFEYTAADARNSLIIDTLEALQAQYSPIEGCDNTFRLILDSNVPDKGVFSCYLDESASSWDIRNITGSVGAGGVFGWPVWAKAEVTDGAVRIEPIAAETTSIVSSSAVRASTTGGDGPVYLSARSGVRLSLPTAGTTGRVDFSVPGAAAGTVILLSEVDNLVQLAGLDPATLVETCFVAGAAVSGEDLPPNMLRCLVEEAGSAIDTLPNVPSKAKTAFKSIGKILLVIDAVAWEGQSELVTEAFAAVEHRYIPPPPSGPWGGGGSGGGGGPESFDGTLPSDRQSWQYSILQSGFRSYLLLDGEGGEIFHLPSGGDYVCYAQSYPVVWDVAVQSGPWVWYNVTDDISCDGTHPTFSLPLNATNWVVRFSDERSVFIGADSRVYQIRDGGCFEQLAYNHYVLDFTPEEVLTDFEVVPGPSNSAC